MDTFVRAVLENCLTEESEEAANELEHLLECAEVSGEAFESVMTELACRMLKLEIAAFRLGYEMSEFAGVHPSTGTLREAN